MNPNVVHPFEREQEIGRKEIIRHRVRLSVALDSRDHSGGIDEREEALVLAGVDLPGDPATRAATAGVGRETVVDRHITGRRRGRWRF